MIHTLLAVLGTVARHTMLNKREIVLLSRTYHSNGKALHNEGDKHIMKFN